MIDAVILAGADTPESMKELTDEKYEALIDINGKPMIQWIIDTLRASGRVDRIVAVGPKEALDAALEGQNVAVLERAGSILENLKIGLDSLDGNKMALVVTADIPLLTVPAIEDFIDKAGEIEADIYYSVVPKEAVERRFPGARRTYVTLKDGTFTGGNVFIINPSILERTEDLFRKGIEMRKKPLKLLPLLGIGCIIKALTGRLRIKELEERIGKMLNVKGKALITEFAEIGVDVDKPGDLELVRRFLH